MEDADGREFDRTVQVATDEGFLMRTGEMATDTRSEEHGAEAEKERRLAFERTIKDMVDEEYEAVFGDFQEELDKMNEEVVRKALDNLPACADPQQDITPADDSPPLEGVSETDGEAHIKALVDVLPLLSQSHSSSQIEIMGSVNDGRLGVRRTHSPAMMALTDNLDWADHQERASPLPSRYSPPRKSAEFVEDDPFDTSSFGLSIFPQDRKPEIIDMTDDDDLFATAAYIKPVSTQHHPLPDRPKFVGDNLTKNERPVWHTNDLTLKKAAPTRYKQLDDKPPQKSQKSQKNLHKASPNTSIGARPSRVIGPAGAADHVVPLNAPTGPRQQRANTFADRVSHPTLPSSSSYSPRSHQPTFLSPIDQGPSLFQINRSIQQPEPKITSSKPFPSVQPLSRQPGDVRLSRKDWGTAEIKRD